MVKLKGKVNDIKELLQLIKLEGKDPDGSNSSMIDNCILVAKDGKVSTRVLAKTSTVMAFIEYTTLDVIEEGNLPIGSITEFLSYLKRFENEDEINIETTENRIKISRDDPKKVAHVPLTAEKNIDDSVRAESVKDSITEEGGKYKFRNTELPASIKVNVHFIKQVLDDGNVQGLTRKYPITIDEEVSCKVGDEKGGLIETTIPVENIKGKASSSFAAGIDNVMSNLEGEIEIYLGDKGPMLVIQNRENLKAKFVIAPLVDEE